jgi:hypothetical protein
MLRTFTLFAIAALPCVADVQITTSYNADGQAAEATISSNGKRMRYDYGNGVVMLRYCDQQKMVQIDDKAKTFVTVSAAEASKPAEGAKTEVSDTGERKELFGHQAKHLKITEITTGKKERTETDGWYVDLATLGACFAGDAVSADRGYPASYTITAYGESGKPTSNVTMKITGMAEGPLSSSLFDVPEGYKDTSLREVAKTAAPKTAGTVRIGAVMIRDNSNPSVQNSPYYDKLAAQLMEAKFDLIQIDAAAPEAIENKARETGCDFVLHTEIANVAKPQTGKALGLLHKTPGLGKATGGEGMEAHVDYRLVPVGGGAPVLTATAIGRAGTQVNFKAAAMLASNVLPMAMAAKMFKGALNPSMMNAMMSGKGYGAAMTGGDPMMGGIANILRATTQTATTQGSGAQSPTAAEAITIAIDQESKAVIAHLKPAAQ